MGRWMRQVLGMQTLAGGLQMGFGGLMGSGGHDVPLLILPQRGCRRTESILRIPRR